MATLYIAEFQAHTVRDIPTAFAPPLAEQTVAIGAGSAQSNALNPNTGMVRLHADSVCSVAIGVNPTAAATNMRLAAGQTEYFTCRPGLKIAVISNT